MTKEQGGEQTDWWRDEYRPLPVFLLYDGILVLGHSISIDHSISSQSNTLTFLSDISPASLWKLQHESINTSRLLVLLFWMGSMTAPWNYELI